MGYQRDDPVPAHAEAVCQISLACGAHVYAWVDDFYEQKVVKAICELAYKG
ncbi:hypothetical protein OKW30_005790 [Paraburkholderia sp. Clong3]